LSKPKTDLDPQSKIHKTMAHPYRVLALNFLSKRAVASPKEIALASNVELSKMSYHVRELAKTGWLELVKTEPRRGATEHYYRSTKQAIFASDEWVQVPKQIRESITAAHLGEVGNAISDALESGTFEARTDRHAALLEFAGDEEGWSETAELLDETLERLLEIRAKSAERLQEAGDEQARVPIVVTLHGFEGAK
jgi:DNA-binding transcriptional regulator GbsR (MarR family)